MTSHPYGRAALRAGARAFLTGKAASAALTFVILLLLVRVMPVGDYAAYVTLVAAVEVLLAISGFGLPWVATRFVPEYRLRAGGPALRRFIFGWLAVAGSVLLAASLASVWVGSAYASWARLNVPAAALSLASGLLFVEGLGRYLRDCLLEPLLQQVAARASLVMRQMLLLFGIGWLNLSGNVELVDLLMLELMVAALAALISAAWLLQHLWVLRNIPANPEFAPTNGGAMTRLAAQMYGTHLLALPYAPATLLQWVQRTAGPETSAAFGFLRSLFEQVARFLPSNLLLSLVRPRLVAAYVEGGAAALVRDARLVGKVSLLAVVPLVAAALVGAEALATFASAGRAAGSGELLAWLALSLVPLSLRFVAETAAVAGQQGSQCLRAAAVAAVAALLASGPLASVSTNWPAQTILLGHGVFVATLLLAVRRRLGSVLPWATLLRLTAAVLLPVMPSWLAARAGLLFAEGVAMATLGAALALVLALLLGPLSADEWARMRNLFRGASKAGAEV